MDKVFANFTDTPVFNTDKEEVEWLIDAGFLSLAKKLYIDNYNAVEYILSMYYKIDFLMNMAFRFFE